MEDFHWIFDLLDTYLISFPGLLTKDQSHILKKIIKVQGLEKKFTEEILEKIKKRYLTKESSPFFGK